MNHDPDEMYFPSFFPVVEIHTKNTIMDVPKLLVKSERVLC
jgi:hypothetical protein